MKAYSVSKIEPTILLHCKQSGNYLTLEFRDTREMREFADQIIDKADEVDD